MCQHMHVFVCVYMSCVCVSVYMFVCMCIVKVKFTQSCPTLCDPMDYTVHGILQARILEWVAIPFCKDLPNPGTEPGSPTLQTDSLPAEPQGKPMYVYMYTVKSQHVNAE